MKMNKNSFIKLSIPLCTLWLILLMLSGCVSTFEKVGQALDGSLFAEKKIESYGGNGIKLDIVENKENEQSVRITLENFPMMTIRTSIPDENGEIYLISLEYLAGNNHGWNEFTLDLLGEGIMTELFIQINEDIEFVQISSGRIHRYDTRIVGTEALTALRNRHQRIEALTEWMTSQDSAPHGQSIVNFEKYWKPILFPRPALWLEPGDSFQRADDIRINTSYTERTFSEELWSVRNSGTMLRDWEEALPWIYMEYEWENILQILSRKNILEKRR